MKIATHITHESMKKIGGIGAVLNGLCTTEAYKNFFAKTILYGPLFDSGVGDFPNFGGEGEILFSTPNSHDTNNYRKLFEGIIKQYSIDIVYGKRRLISEFDSRKENAVDILLIGTRRMNEVEVAKFKYRLWEKFGIQSDLYSGNWDYEQYLRLAVPFLEILEKLYGKETEYYHFAHEYMGVPSALSVVLAGRSDKTIFVAHEVATARFLVESHSGHDISFYNILHSEWGKKSLEEVFGSQRQNPRNELIKRAVNFHRIFAVSDLIKNEYLFLVPNTPPEKIRVVYNGLPTKSISLQRKEESRKRIETYLKKLFNFVPDVIFTHVARLVISKAIWRDITLLYYLDELLASKNLKGAYILLSTLIATGRTPEDILHMEKDYGWPVKHREGWPDLIGMEKEVHAYLEIFNKKSKAIKGLFINQFGFNRERCGLRVPQDAQFIDLRIASDAEFGFSIYEPFGIAQLEVIPFGGISILSSSCGCVSLLQKTFQNAKVKPFYVLDFAGEGKEIKFEELKKLTREKRTTIEAELFSKHAHPIFKLLPTDEAKRAEYLDNAQTYSSELSWENVVKNYFLPNLPT